MNTITQTNSFETINLANLSRVSGGAVPRNDHEKQDLANAAAQGAKNGSSVGTDVGRAIRGYATHHANNFVRGVTTIGSAIGSLWNGLTGG